MSPPRQRETDGPFRDEAITAYLRGTPASPSILASPLWVAWAYRSLAPSLLLAGVCASIVTVTEPVPVPVVLVSAWHGGSGWNSGPHATSECTCTLARRDSPHPSEKDPSPYGTRLLALVPATHSRRLPSVLKIALSPTDPPLNLAVDGRTTKRYSLSDACNQIGIAPPPGTTGDVIVLWSRIVPDRTLTRLNALIPAGSASAATVTLLLPQSSLAALIPALQHFSDATRLLLPARGAGSCSFHRAVP